jgi:hypothetical protein
LFKVKEYLTQQGKDAKSQVFTKERKHKDSTREGMQESDPGHRGGLVKGIYATFWAVCGVETQ